MAVFLIREGLGATSSQSHCGSCALGVPCPYRIWRKTRQQTSSAGNVYLRPERASRAGFGSLGDATSSSSDDATAIASQTDTMKRLLQTVQTSRPDLQSAVASILQRTTNAGPMPRGPQSVNGVMTWYAQHPGPGPFATADRALLDQAVSDVTALLQSPPPPPPQVALSPAPGYAIPGFVPPTPVYQTPGYAPASYPPAVYQPQVPTPAAAPGILDGTVTLPGGLGDVPKTWLAAAAAALGGILLLRRRREGA